MEAFFKVNHSRIYNKDCLFMEELGDESVDLIATDPPYGISFMGKDWDKALPDKNIWRECLRVLKTGAFAFVMSIPRADCLSRMIINLEDAGFNVGFSPIYHAFASGFPKAQNIGKAVDKRLGVKGQKIGVSVGKGYSSQQEKNKEEGFRPYTEGLPYEHADRNVYSLASPQAKALDGSYGGFQPKPAVEVIIVAMKPLSEKTYVDQALKNGKGITWLDSCRIPYESEEDKEGTRFGTQMDIRGGNLKTPKGIRAKNVLSSPTGRFPANLLVSDDVLNDGRITQSGKDAIRKQEGMFVEHHLGGVGNLQVYHPDSGSFSRYFDLDKWWAKTFPFLIVPKASKSEKNKGLETMPEVVKSGLPLRDGSGDYVLNEYGDSSMSTRNTKTRNYHPTIKPIKLMSYLITLGSREGDTVVDPFIGTGSTAIACQILGRKCSGYEINANYCEIAKSRLTYYCQKAMNV